MPGCTGCGRERARGEKNARRYPNGHTSQHHNAARHERSKNTNEHRNAARHGRSRHTNECRVATRHWRSNTCGASPRQAHCTATYVHGFAAGFVGHLWGQIHAHNCVKAALESYCTQPSPASAGGGTQGWGGVVVVVEVGAGGGGIPLPYAHARSGGPLCHSVGAWCGGWRPNDGLGVVAAGSGHGELTPGQARWATGAECPAPWRSPPACPPAARGSGTAAPRQGVARKCQRSPGTGL
jgi:hypothetical protein